MFPVVYTEALKACAGLIIFQDVLRLLADHFRIGVGNKAACPVADGSGDMALLYREAVHRIFIAQSLQGCLQVPGAVDSQEESVRLSLSILHQDRRAKLRLPCIGVLRGSHDGIGITQQHRPVFLAEVFVDGKACIAVAGDKFLPGAVKAHQVFGPGDSIEFRQACARLVIRMLRQETRQHLCP